MGETEPVPGTVEKPVALVSGQPVRDRGARRWLLVLSLVLGLMVLCQVGALGVSLFGFVDMFAGMDTTDRSADIERDIRAAFGDDVESASVRQVSMTYGTPFPYSLMDIPGEQAYAIEYRLRGIDVDCAGLSTSFDISPEPAGLIPPRSSISNRMDADRFKELLVVFAEHSDAPFGGLARYSSEEAQFTGTAMPATLTVDGKDYATGRLWAVVEGFKVEGDTFDAGGGESQHAVVLYDDPKTGEFVFLGVEPYSGMFW